MDDGRGGKVYLWSEVRRMMDYVMIGVLLLEHHMLTMPNRVRNRCFDWASYPFKVYTLL